MPDASAPSLDVIVGFVLIANAGVMAANLQYQGELVGRSLGVLAQDEGADWSQAEKAFAPKN